MKAKIVVLMAVLLVNYICYATHSKALAGYDNVAKGESEPGCLCPADVNTTGTYIHFCGRDLTPDKCPPESILRCVNGRTKAIKFWDCTPEGTKCGLKTKMKDGSHCRSCEAHRTKICIKD